MCGGGGGVRACASSAKRASLPPCAQPLAPTPPRPAVPTLCTHPRLPTTPGTCRLCLVEEGGRLKPACATPVWDGMKARAAAPPSLLACPHAVCVHTPPTPALALTPPPPACPPLCMRACRSRPTPQRCRRASSGCCPCSRPTTRWSATAATCRGGASSRCGVPCARLATQRVCLLPSARPPPPHTHRHPFARRTWWRDTTWATACRACAPLATSGTRRWWRTRLGCTTPPRVGG